MGSTADVKTANASLDYWLSLVDLLIKASEGVERMPELTSSGKSHLMIERIIRTSPTSPQDFMFGSYGDLPVCGC